MPYPPPNPLYIPPGTPIGALNQALVALEAGNVELAQLLLLTPQLPIVLAGGGGIPPLYLTPGYEFTAPAYTVFPVDPAGMIGMAIPAGRPPVIGSVVANTALPGFNQPWTPDPGGYTWLPPNWTGGTYRPTTQNPWDPEVIYTPWLPPDPPQGPPRPPGMPGGPLMLPLIFPFNPAMTLPDPLPPNHVLIPVPGRDPILGVLPPGFTTSPTVDGPMGILALGLLDYNPFAPPPPLNTVTIYGPGGATFTPYNFSPIPVQPHLNPGSGPFPTPQPAPYFLLIFNPPSLTPVPVLPDLPAIFPPNPPPGGNIYYLPVPVPFSGTPPEGLNPLLCIQIVGATVNGQNDDSWNGMTGILAYNGSEWVGSVAGFAAVANVSEDGESFGVGLGATSVPLSFRSFDSSQPLNLMFGSQTVVGSNNPHVVLYVTISG